MVNNNDGTFTFDPGSDFQDLAMGETRSVRFVYRAYDSHNAWNPATVTITVTGANDTPNVTVNTTSVVVNEGEMAVNSGIFDDPDLSDLVDIMAVNAAGELIGKISQDIGNTGNWDWTLDAIDGPVDEIVTIIAKDVAGATGSKSFSLSIGNNQHPLVQPQQSVSGDLEITWIEGKDTTEIVIFQTATGGWDQIVGKYKTYSGTKSLDVPGLDDGTYYVAARSIWFEDGAWQKTRFSERVAYEVQSLEVNLAIQFLI